MNPRSLRFGNTLRSGREREKSHRDAPSRAFSRGLKRARHSRVSETTPLKILTARIFMTQHQSAGSTRLVESEVLSTLAVLPLRVARVPGSRTRISTVLRTNSFPRPRWFFLFFFHVKFLFKHVETNARERERPMLFFRAFPIQKRKRRRCSPAVDSEDHAPATRSNGLKIRVLSRSADATRGLVSTRTGPIRDTRLVRAIVCGVRDPDCLESSQRSLNFIPKRSRKVAESALRPLRDGVTLDILIAIQEHAPTCASQKPRLRASFVGGFKE